MRFLCIFLVFILHLPNVYWSCDHLTYIVLIIGYIYIYMLMYVIHLSFHVLFLFFLYTHVSYIMYAILFSVSHEDGLMSFV